ncbi:hypothetical protein [Pendulispora brunnea]
MYKRLERGVFRFPSAIRPGDPSIEIDAAEFTKILAGLDLPAAKGTIGTRHRARASEISPPVP